MPEPTPRTPPAPPDTTIALSVPARPTSLELVHTAVAQLWSDHETVGVPDRIRFETAVVEIFANIVEHAFRTDPEVPDPVTRRLEVRLSASPARLEADFSDNGLPAELDLSAVTLPDDEATSGRGLAMAIAAVDDLRYERHEGRNYWSLTCDRT